MEAAQQPTRSIDVTGLPEEAVLALQSLVELLREKQGTAPPSLAFASYEEWHKAFREWVDSHPKLDTIADDSRESIYAGGGE